VDPMVVDAPVSQSAIVTLDVLHSGIIWGWYVTMNFWAKSISTGLILLSPWILRASNDRRTRLLVAGLSFVFINITLLFTVLDLHQPFRFWHMFAHPHLDSVINLGAWLLTAFNGLLVLMAWLAWKSRTELYDRLMPVAWVLAFLSTIYTAGLLGQANAREVWHAPTEVAQMILAATLLGSAMFLLLRLGDRRWLATVLGLSAGVSLTIYVSEVIFAPQKSEEAEFVMHTLTGGRIGVLFGAGLLLAFVIPMGLAYLGVRRDQPRLLFAASALSLVGLWLVKHAWLIAPQLIPLS
jgi:protein NrfD